MSCVKEYFPKIFSLISSNYPAICEGIYYSVNFPALPPDEIKGIKVAPMAPGHWEKEWEKTDLPTTGEGETLYKMSGYFVDDTPEGQKGLDYGLLKEGYIVITPLLVDNTARKEVTRLKKILRSL